MFRSKIFVQIWPIRNFVWGGVLCSSGQPQVWDEHHVLEDRCSHSGQQSSETRVAEKCPHRRFVFYFQLFLLQLSLHQIFIHSPCISSLHLQVWPTHRSVSLVSRAHSAECRAPPRASPALGTPIRAMGRAPAPPVTRPRSMQVGPPPTHALDTVWFTKGENGCKLDFSCMQMWKLIYWLGAP